MADKIITIKIPSEKVAIALQGFLKIYPNVEREEQVDPEVQPDLKYSNVEWVNERVRRLIVRDVKRGLQMLANETATVADDDGIAEIV